MGKRVWLWNHYATGMAISKGGRHYNFAANLVQRGYEPTIFCANTFHRDRKPIPLNGDKYKKEIIEGIPFVFVKTSPYKGNGISRINNMFSFYRTLFPVAKEYANSHGKPDVILASSVHPLTMVAGIQIAKRFNIPCICEVRDLWPEAIFAFGKAKETSVLGRILVKGEHWIYKNSHAMVFTKEGDVDYLKERKWDLEQGGDIDLKKCHYINNGVNLDSFYQSVNKYPLRDEALETKKFNVVYTGAIRPVNNVGNILNAAELLREEKDIQFLIYGSGTQKEELVKRAFERNLENVKFKGQVDKKYIPYVLSKSSANLLNYSATQYNWSRGNSSNKLFEYMASGKPIISTVKMGYCILAQYNCGISLEQSTPEELAKAILQVKNMPEEEYRAMGENGKNGARDFDFSVLTERLVRVIEGVLNK